MPPPRRAAPRRPRVPPEPADGRRARDRRRRAADGAALAPAAGTSAPVRRNATNASTATPIATIASSPPAIAKWLRCRTIVGPSRFCGRVERLRAASRDRRRRCARGGVPLGSARRGEHAGVLGRAAADAGGRAPCGILRRSESDRQATSRARGREPSGTTPADRARWHVHRRRRVRELLLDHADRGVRLKGQRAGQQAVEHDAARVQIGAAVDFLGEHLFGRHVRRRAHHEAVVGQVLRADDARDAEVHDLDAAGLGRP